MSQRPELLTRIEGLLQESSSRDPANWNRAFSALMDAAHETDQEWLADRLQDAMYHLGLSPNTAEAERLLASRGMVDWDDDAPGEPTAIYVRFHVSGETTGFMPGGKGAVTWARCNDRDDAVWLSIASEVVPPVDLEEATQLLDGSLHAVGVQRV